MRVIDRHKLVWISKAKTGSTSIRALLDPFSDIKSGSKRPFWHHNGVQGAAEDLEASGRDPASYEYVLCERNPWTLVPSYFKFSRINQASQAFWEEDYNPAIPQMNFAEFLELDQTWDVFHNRLRLEAYDDHALLRPRVFMMEQKTVLPFLQSRIPGFPDTLPIKNASSYDAADLASFGLEFSKPAIAEKMHEVFRTSIGLFGYRNVWS